MSGTTPYTPSGNWPDLDGTGGQGPLELQDDGQVLLHSETFRNDSDPKRGILAKLIDAADYLKKNAGASAVAAYSGASFTIAAGTLETFLHLLANKAAKLDGSNTFTGAVNTFLALAFQSALLAVVGTVADTSTTNIDVTRFLWIVPTVSQQITATALNANAQNGNILAIVRLDDAAHAVVVKTEGGGASVVTLDSATKGSGALLVRVGGVWRLLVGGQNTTPGADA